MLASERMTNKRNEVEATDESATGGAVPYYLAAQWDVQRATIAELKTILARHGIPIPTGRILKEEYVTLFRASRNALLASHNQLNKATTVAEESKVALAPAAEPHSPLIHQQDEEEGEEHEVEEVEEEEEEEGEEQQQLQEDLQESQERVENLVKRFDAANEVASVDNVSDAIANAVLDRKKKLVEFGKGITSSFGFARRTLLDPAPGPAKRPERLKRGGPPPLPPPPYNPQQHLRSVASVTARPDFVVPVAPPSCVSNTGLSPPPALIDRKFGPLHASPTSPRGAGGGLAGLTYSKRSPGARGAKPGGSPLGLRSTGPSRIPRAATAATAAVAAVSYENVRGAICNAPFTPRGVPGGVAATTASPTMGTAVLGTSAAANVVPFNSQSTDEKGSVVKTGDQPSTLSNYISATDAINKNTTTTTGIDAEFKRKYNLDDTLLLSEDEDEDASVAAANARDKSPNKRRKSMNLNAAGLSGISHGSGGGSYYVVTSSASTEASLFGSSGSETVASPSPGRYNLRHRAPASGVAGVPSPAVGVPSPLLRESVMNSAVKAQMQQLERKQVVKMDEKMNPSVKVRDGIEGVDEFKEIGHIEMPDLTDQIAALTSNVAVCEEDMAREAEENVCDDLADKVEVAAFEADVKRRRGIAMKKVGKLLAGYVAAAFLLPFFWAMGNWWVQVASVMQYCEAGVTAAPRWVDFSESFVSHRGTAIDVWGQFLPHCVVCPSGAVCEGAEVVGCMKAGEYIFGDEGFGPFGSMVGLGPACLDEMTMKSDQTGARFLEGENFGNSHVNKRIRGRPLPLGKRLAFWHKTFLEGSNSDWVAAFVRNLEALQCKFVWAGKVVSDVTIEAVDFCTWAIPQMQSMDGARRVLDSSGKELAEVYFAVRKLHNDCLQYLANNVYGRF